MSLREKIQNKEFIITAEIGPPKGVDVKEILDNAQLLKGKVDAINVTDLQSSVMKLGSLAVSHMLVDMGIEPVFQITCRDRNRLALQSDLFSAYVLGIRNVLVLTGDHPKMGDHPNAKPVFDLDSVQLLEVVKKLQSGFDMMGNPLTSIPKFCVGAVVNPCAENLDLEIIKMEKKIRSGAEFFQTQAIYDIKRFENFLNNIKHLNTTILAGIVLLKSAGMARFMNKNVAGIYVPDELIEEIASVPKEKIKEKSAQIAVRLANQIKDICNGIHFMPLGWDEVLVDVLGQLGLKQ